MTKLHSELDDNNGLCEACSSPETLYQRQSRVKVLLAGFGAAGGPATGTMWVCTKCKPEVEKKYAEARKL